MFEFVFGSRWLINASDVKSGKSAILNENYFSFYSIHGIAVGIILSSLISSVIVIYSILRKSCKKKKIDISIRFPLYLAIADGLWSISHLLDHIYLICFKSYPNEKAIGLSINLWTFLGYQQLIHCSLAVYTYVKVVRRSSLELGPWEWKLHLFCSLFIGSTILLFLPIKAFGPTGYWYMHDVNSAAGIFLGFTVGIVLTSNGIITAFTYHSVINEVARQKSTLKITTKITYHKRTIKKLARFVKIASYLYIPTGVLYTALTFQNAFAIIEPMTVFFIIVLANSSGWANALGYFQNERNVGKNDKTDSKSNNLTNSTTVNSHSNQNQI